jgi:hypothetical protein
MTAGRRAPVGREPNGPSTRPIEMKLLRLGWTARQSTSASKRKRACAVLNPSGPVC